MCCISQKMGCTISQFHMFVMASGWEPLGLTGSESPQGLFGVDRHFDVEVFHVKLLEEVLVIIIACTVGCFCKTYLTTAQFCAPWTSLDIKSQLSEPK